MGYLGSCNLRRLPLCQLTLSLFNLLFFNRLYIDADIGTDFVFIQGHASAGEPCGSTLMETRAYIAHFQLADDVVHGRETMPSSENGLARQIARLFKELVERELISVERTIEGRKRNLRRKIEARESELKDDGGLETRFDQYKAGLSETERPESRVQERRLYYNWEGRLRSELGRWRIELAELKSRSSDSQATLTNARRKVMRLLLRETLTVAAPEDNHEPESGADAYDSLEDCLIPVIRHMKKGKSHSEAFRMVAEELGIRETTVAARCTGCLDLTTEQFVEHVANGGIVRVAKKKHPDQTELICRELAPLYR